MKSILPILLLAAFAAPALSADSESGKSLKSGLNEGEYVPSFYTRAVTGPLMNKSVCYVCRNGSRPVVMLLMRRIHPELKPLVKNIDRLVDANRANGLRSFGVLIHEDSIKATSAVQTFAFNNKIALPLTIAGDTTTVAGNKEAAVTVVLYRKRKVVETFAFRPGELEPRDVKHVLERIKRFAADE